MDETLVAFATLFCQKRFPNSFAVTGSALALTLGGIVGLVLLHRALARVPARRLLIGACAGAIAAAAAAVTATSALSAVIAFACLGACASTHYPLAQSAAYRAVPASADRVAALSQLFGPIDLAIPLVLGFLADRYGVGAALVGLLVQPLWLIGAATLTRNETAEVN
jgi:fucose permease